MSLAALGYNTKTVAKDEAAVKKLLGKANLVYDTDSMDLVDHPEPTAAPAGVHMVTRTPVDHSAGLLRGETVTKLVRVTLLHSPMAVVSHVPADAGGQLSAPLPQPPPVRLAVLDNVCATASPPEANGDE